MRLRIACLAVLPFVLAASARAASPGGEAALRFVRNGETLRALTPEELSAVCTPETIVVEDPYYARTKRYRACPLAKVLGLGFGSTPAELSGEDFFLRAKDGYTRPSTGAVLAEPGGFLAFADADLPAGGWEPIDRRQLDPGPFYLVWTGEAQRDPHRHPWPYQLVTIEIAPFAREFPHVSPAGLPPEAPAWRGFAVFKTQCLACHAVNGEGGTVGPELNVPQSIVEYRPKEQIKAYVRNPERFRYTTMPAHESLSDAELDALVAYFEAMRDRKHDPRKGKAP